MTSPRRFPSRMPLRGGRTGALLTSSWAERVLHSLGAQPAFADMVLGDLAEERARREQEDGTLAAGWWYAREAFRSAPHLIWNAVRHGGSRGRARVAAGLALVALVPAAVVIALLLRDGPPARLVIEGQGGSIATDGLVLNSMHPVQLAMRVFDAKGNALPTTRLRYQWDAGVPLRVTPGGVVTCKAGDATVRASVGAVATRVLLRCRPVKEIRAQMWMQFVIGDSAQDLSFRALDPNASPVDLLAGELRVEDSTIATLKGISVRPLRPGRTAVTVRIGDAEALTSVSVYEPVRTFGELRSDQRYVVAPVRLARGDTIRWPLPKGLFWLLYSRGSDAEPIPAFAVDGPVMCMPDFGPTVDNVSCLVRGPGATIRMAHPGTEFPVISGRLALEMLERQ